MKRLAVLLLSAAPCGLVSALAADLPSKAPASATATAAPQWEATFDWDARYYSWHGTRGFPTTTAFTPGSGSQFYAPFGLAVTGRPSADWKLDFLIRSGYVSSTQTTPGFSGSTSTATDTSVTGTATYNGFNGFSPYLMVATNLPTGTTALLGTDTFARMDPDLVGTGSFGEGFNVGLTGGVNLNFSERFVVSVGAGYTWRGSYDREGFVNPAFVVALPGIGTVGPGDVFNATVSAVYRVGTLTLYGSGSYSRESETDRNGVAFFQNGDRYLASGGISYDWDQSSTSTLAMAYAHMNSNKVLGFGLPPLVQEAFNSNSNVYQATFDHRFKFASWAVGPTAGFLYRDNNSWNPATLQFVSAKTRGSMGGVATYSVNDRVALTGRLEGVWIAENDNPGNFVPSLKGTGLLASLGGTVRF